MKRNYIILFILITIIFITCVIQIYNFSNEIEHFKSIHDFEETNIKDDFNFYRFIKEFVRILITLYTIFIAVIIFLENKNSEKTISWLLLLVISPIGGLILYHFLGQNIRKRKIFNKKENISFKGLKNLAKTQLEAVKDSPIFMSENNFLRKKHINLILNNCRSPVTVNNKSKILTNGKMKFHELKKDLINAKDHIHLEYYIFKDDNIGSEIKEILIKKAKEGVKVRIIYDSVGSFSLKKKTIKYYIENGVEIVGFLPVFLPRISREVNYRNHRKIIIIDGKIGYIGGINIGDEYLGKVKKYGFWRDTHIKIEGEAVYALQNIFFHDWYFCKKERLSGIRYYPKLTYYGEELIQIIASGPDTEWETVLQSYFSLITYATKRVWITTPYLVPDDSVMMALKIAALSGIDVRIIIPDVPDHKIVYWSTRSNIEVLLRAGVKIYKYKKGFIHCKNLLVDDIISSIGTANLDYRSFLIDFEVNALIYDKEVSLKLEKDFIRDFNDSIEIKYEEWIERSLFEKIQDSIGRLLSPLL